MLISAESVSVAEQYALNISLLLRDIPVYGVCEVSENGIHG